jgi:hypothetical protein
VCEDDLIADEKRYARSLAVLRRRKGEEIMDDISSASDSDSSEFDDDVEEEAGRVVDDPCFTAAAGHPKVEVMPMDVDADVDVHGDGIRLVLEPEKLVKEEEAKHMHPVVQRPAPIQIQTINLASYTDPDTDMSARCGFPLLSSFLTLT